MMYSFLIVAATNYCKFNGLQNRNSLSSSSEGQNIEMGFYGLKLDISRAAFDLGENKFPCFLQLLKAACIPWLMAPSHIIQTSMTAFSKALFNYNTNSSVSLFHFLELCDYNKTTWVTQDNLIILKSDVWQC